MCVGRTYITFATFVGCTPNSKFIGVSDWSERKFFVMTSDVSANVDLLSSVGSLQGAFAIEIMQPLQAEEPSLLNTFPQA